MVLSVDVVPAYTSGVNDFKQDMYMVPELAIRRRHAVRRTLYDELARSGRVMNWIKSDPRGYIKVAKLINEKNEDFRKSAKFVKAWKWACKEQSDNFKLKSFHIEQVITGYFSNNPQLEIYDAVLQFFQNLPRIIERAQIPDRADNAVFIDSYVNDLTGEERQAIIEAGTLFLQKLQTLTSESELGNLFEDTVKRAKKALTKGFPIVVTSRDQSFVPARPGRVAMAEQDPKWVSEEYPGLIIREDVASGSIEFTAAYDELSGRFTVVRTTAADARAGAQRYL